MNEQEINAAIAEACDRWRKSVSEDVWFRNGTFAYVDQLPNYCADLNALHEAEKILTADQCWLMSKHLDSLCGVSGGIGSGTLEEHTWHATAKQRAIALVKTLGKWRDACSRCGKADAGIHTCKGGGA